MILEKLIKSAEQNYFRCRRESYEKSENESEMSDLNSSDVDLIDIDMNMSFSFDNISFREREQEAEISEQNRASDTTVVIYPEMNISVEFDGSEFQDIVTGPEDDCDLDDIIVTKLEDTHLKSAFSPEQLTPGNDVKNDTENKVEWRTRVHNTYLEGTEIALRTKDDHVCCFSKNFDYAVRITELHSRNSIKTIIGSSNNFASYSFR